MPAGTHDGNLRTVTESTLEVSLDGSVTTDTVVKNQKDVQSVALKFSTGNDPITVDQVKLTGYIDGDAGGMTGDWDGQDADASNTRLKDVVQNVRLVNDGSVLAVGTVQASGAKNVATDGTVTFSGMNWDLLSNSSEVTEVWYDVSSSAYTGGTGEHVAFDIDNVSTDVDATNDEGDSVTPTPAGSVNGEPG
ncbi:hypothetical protein KJ855_00880, partial [Patescibacteria group bacterium]|nr:hypothetical protein [Patescibacteria group bacterium]